MYENIPQELKLLRQWVVADASKAPYNPNTRTPASITDPSTWGTYEQALATHQGGAPYIGFVFAPDDPYSMIDLDDHPERPATDIQKQRFAKILQAFPSYAEVSASGRGVHIIVRGIVPTGQDRDNVGIYSAGRHGIMTGNVLNAYPITDCQQLLTLLWTESGGSMAAPAAYDDRPSPFNDNDLMVAMCNASNRDKVMALCRGEWQGIYPSQSEADMALLSILTFYSPDNEQVKRVFRLTSLGTRIKAVRDDVYLNRSIGKIRSSQPAIVDMSKLVLPVPGSAPIVAIAPSPAQDIPYTNPPGLVGQIAEYMLGQAIRPVPEIALAGALALVAGLIGRSYNVSGSGLNQYIAVIALTGTGKEAAASGINSLMHAVRAQVPSVDQFLGPGDFASAQGILRTLERKPCFVSVLGEFGHTLQKWSDPRQPGAVTKIRQVLLDSFGKSGKGQILYATAYSDSDKDIKMVASPCITILGEATPESFFDNLTMNQVAEGLIPRFSIIEYNGERPMRNKARQLVPTPELMARVANLASTALYTASNSAVKEVGIEASATQLYDAFDELADSHIRGHGEADRQLWNRAHLKALKLGALVAAANNPHEPTITPIEAQWAIDFVTREIGIVSKRFAQQKYGNSEGRYEGFIRDVVENYFTIGDDAKRNTYKVPEQMLGAAVIPFCYLRRRLKRLSAFDNDKRGATMAIKIALQDMVDAGILQLVPPIQVQTQYGSTSAAYIVGKGW